MPYLSFLKTVNSIYDEIVHFRRNVFNIPSGKAGKNFIAELTFWLRQFNSPSHLNSISLKVFMILPSLMLQKPSAKSKAKEHSTCLSRRLDLWKNGDLGILVKEIKQIQKKFVMSKKTRSFDDISRIFASHGRENFSCD